VLLGDLSELLVTCSPQRDDYFHASKGDNETVASVDLDSDGDIAELGV
jgi:hypothetical protein